MNNEMRERFDKEFKLGEDFWRFDCGHDSAGFEYTEQAELLKTFIQQEIDKAIAEERKDIVEKVKKIAYGKDMRGRSYIDIDDFINLLQNK